MLQVVVPLALVNSLSFGLHLVEFANSVAESAVPISIVPGVVGQKQLTSAVSSSKLISLALVPGIVILEIYH